MEDVTFSLWPEEPTPADCLHCSECGIHQHGSRMVWGEGNPEAPVIVLLDNPGAREDRENQPFICGTRQTLQQAVYEVGFTKDELYMTYVLKRKPTRAYEKEKTREICMNHFKKQLETRQPQLVVCLGNIAVQSFFEEPAKDVKTLRGDIHHVRGFQVAVAYHPLAVRRRPNLWPLFLEDWKMVAEHVGK